MAEVLTEKPVCAKCGSDVRDGTSYCYNCGAKVIDEVMTEDASVTAPDLTNAAEDAPDLEKTVLMTPAEDNGSGPLSDKSQLGKKERVSRAAKERKRSRVRNRQPVEYRWEPSNDLRLTLIAAILLTIIVAVITGLMVFWK